MSFIVFLYLPSKRDIRADVRLGGNFQVKALAADLGMDRADVLSFLRNPPPELLLMSASLDEESAERTASSKLAEASGRMKPSKVVTPEKREPELKPATAGGPQGPKSWHSNKRLRKEHIATFERVYRQSQRPSVSFILSKVYVHKSCWTTLFKVVSYCYDGAVPFCSRSLVVSFKNSFEVKNCH